MKYLKIMKIIIYLIVVIITYVLNVQKNGFIRWKDIAVYIVIHQIY